MDTENLKEPGFWPENTYPTPRGGSKIFSMVGADFQKNFEILSAFF